MEYDPTNEDDIEQRGKEAAALDRQIGVDIKEILELSSGAGVRFFRWYFSTNKLFGVKMTGNSWTYFNLGLQEAALKMFRQVCKADPKGLPLWIRAFEEMDFEEIMRRE